MTPSTSYIVGVDEVGRGPIAGPLLVCAVLIPENYDPKRLLGVNDSKQLSEDEREEWLAFAEFERDAGTIRWGFGWVESESIDAQGMSLALRQAVTESLLRLEALNDSLHVFLDGSLHAPAMYRQETIIGGDAKVPAISLASVIAKVTRDRHMTALAHTYPNYGFERHKGYGTKAHYEAIQKHGLTPQHRRSFLTKLT